MLITITHEDDKQELINVNSIFKVEQNTERTYEDKEVEVSTGFLGFGPKKKVIKKVRTGVKPIAGSKILTTNFITRGYRSCDRYVTYQERVVYTVKESFEDILSSIKNV